MNIYFNEMINVIKCLGGHINNAVSFALFVAGRISLLRAFCFTVCQMLGSIFGALFLWAIFG